MQLHSAIIRAASLACDLISQYLQKQPPCIICSSDGKIPTARNTDGYKINSTNRPCSH
jgi:hypothetical protein